ncbi:ribose 1,5-bisphosphate phosphokinase PhnN [Aureimonas sp. SA4125]|uniref:phosphonate metabolism protein/1,5-bisphosphokinase (PRPP-forming) PhnN n=1 Tax=Aureimonas sp. SA4125 TaxID=2826993 RepID=UPI001CC773F0|nr:phosphonate metabolism protein/1,5-bisphosphokinase (PRPP-forming) PhnN [Aureimonas sp. SA4125]BDA85656.1 ribose 1,5-bisphosphate phosphokinase PhnN [Aureimonas sp. SA4125]
MPDAVDGRIHGPFIAVVGPSGAGKDTILALARPHLRQDIRFARRVITRVSQVEAEDHDCLDETAFEAAERDGAFCLSWAAHGLRYGLPSSLVAHCEGGNAVVANVSRRALGPAAARFAALHVIEITAPRALLVQRIAARGRESAGEIEARLARNVDLDIPAGAHGPHRIDNSGRVEDAAADFVRLVESLARDAAAAV